MQQNGILLIDKPANMTSFGVVARIRRVLSQQAGKKVTDLILEELRLIAA